MQSIILKNFKSHQHQSITNLNSRINVVVGANGQGKSNFFKAISYLFTDRFTINRAQFNATLYRGANSENPEISVQANFNENQQGDKRGYKLSKSWSNYTNEDLKVNDKSINRREYENFIQSFGLSYTNPYNIVQQGKVSQITQMSENQLYLLLEDTAGVKRFLRKQQDAQSDLRKIQADLAQVQECLKFLKEKMWQVEGKKNQYEYYSVQQKVRRIKKKRQLSNYLGGIQDTVQKMKQKHFEVLKLVQQAKVKEKDLAWEIQEKYRHLEVLTEKTIFYEKQHSDDIQVGGISKSELKKTLSTKKKELRDLQKRVAGQQQSLKQSQEKLSTFQKQLDAYRSKYQMMRLDFQLQGQTKDSKKLRQGYQAKTKTQKQAIKSIQQQLGKLVKLQSQFKPIAYAKQSQESSRVQVQLSQQVQRMKRNRVQQIQLGRNKMNLECEVQTLLGRRKNLQQLIKKVLPMLDLRLKAWLEEYNVKGVYGYLIEHLIVHHNLGFAYELAGLNKLCTLLVEDDKVAAQVVEINRKIKGKNVNILPLSFLRTQINQKRTYPKMDNVFSLVNEEWIRCVNSQKINSEIKSNIQKIINNTFSKYVLVQNYNTALKVSKEYNLNCITSDRQIVFADAYLCKVGRKQVYEKGKIQLFQMFQNMSREIVKNKNSLLQIQKKQVELQNLQIQSINSKQKLQFRNNQLSKTIDQGIKIQSVIQKLESKKVSLNQSIQRCGITINQYEKTLENLKNNVKSKFRLEDFKKAESQYFAHKSKVQEIFNQNYQKEKQRSNLMKSLQIMSKEVQNMQKKGPQSADLLSKQQMLRQIQSERLELESKITELNKSLNKLHDNKISLKQKQLQFLAQLTVQQQNQKDVINKLQGLDDVNEDQQDQIQQLSHSLSRKLTMDSMNTKKRQFYTARDKAFFTKISDYIQKVAFYTKSTGNIRRQKEKLIKYIQETQIQAKKYMKSFVSNFEKHFIRYFLRIVPNGKADLRTKIYTQKLKGITKNGHSLEIKVTFNEEEGIRRWSQFSGGQKTILALCIILAIQKCQPTPFCVLDQVDAALDPFYASKIVDIIVQESQFCQYFITSFKKSMLYFPQNITNYYLVKSVNRISSITHVQKGQIQNLINQIAE